ncbi:HsdM family class I SAM-dependent methyltransferase [Deinococcus aquatilis]|uniref:class I SAM-dependent DNA methyltransferase n=1 Tax=Deinococcus aquatilis TaxID=519440 RepID=UPI00037DCCDE|nr:class I SAM-dependent DNA methyltransferase [Deinococcus aquatilis]
MRLSGLLWSTAEILRGDFKQADYGKVILPMTVARRLDGVAQVSGAAVAAVIAKYGEAAPTALLEHAAGGPVYNITGLTFEAMLGDPANLAPNLIRFTGGFPEHIRDIFGRYRFEDIVRDLEEKDLLLEVFKRFAAVDLSAGAIGTHDMGHVFEELIRRFAELSNETAGEHYTPREVISLMVQLLFTQDDEILSKPGVVRTLYDPTGGTGGMMSGGDEYVRAANPEAKLAVFGQELNDESYAICKADMVIKGYDPKNIQQGNTLTDDKHAGRQFDYVISNPPFGVDWSKAEVIVRKEHLTKGKEGRFGPGLPRRSDGTLLFLLHGLHKLAPGGRMAIVTNGSPLFTGSAGSGESEIRRHILENDLLEAIIALPTDMFFNTGIQTYIWVLAREKAADRVGKVQLIDAGKLFEKMPKSLGSKRNRMNAAHIAQVVRAHGNSEESDISKIFRTEDFGYRTVTIDRPMRHNYQANEERLVRLREDKKLRKHEDLDDIIAALRAKVGGEVFKNRAAFLGYVELALKPLGLKATEFKNIADLLAERDESAEPARDGKKRLIPDTDLRDTEDVPLTEDVQTYFGREVLPYAPDAWISDEVRDPKDDHVGKVGYEIPFNRHFYTYEPPPSLEAIDAQLKARAGRIMELLKVVVG